MLHFAVLTMHLRESKKKTDFVLNFNVKQTNKQTHPSNVGNSSLVNE